MGASGMAIVAHAVIAYQYIITIIGLIKSIEIDREIKKSREYYANLDGAVKLYGNAA
jgi:hypothetical protein